jgi:hypothetical protein
MYAILTNAWVSWKTTILGIAAFVTLNWQHVYAYYLSNQTLDAKHFWLGLIIMVLGIVARDGDKSSEQTGAGNTGNG